MEGPQIREISPLRAMFSARLAYPITRCSLGELLGTHGYVAVNNKELENKF